VKSSRPVKIFSENLLFISAWKTPPKAMKKKPLAEIGEFHRLGQPLRGGHSAQGLDILASIGFGLQFHLPELYPEAAKKNH
jgi:hypothetical protein